MHLVIVKVYYFGIAESIIKNGFYIGDQKYVFFSASAGQIRTKKFVAVREDDLNQVWNTLTCGLSVEHINELGGVNINKYLAYLALCNSATDEWKSFNIDKCIVVNDFETCVDDIVDYIDDETYEITRTKMPVPIPHTDGCGMILPKLSKKNFMVRAPWVKGLLTPFPFDTFAKEHKQTKVRDIYGKEYDIIKDNIQVIFTKSQFKMWKYFDNWEEYRANFKLYGCSAGICNMEEDYIPNAKFNYQMLQTLHDLTDEELKEICSETNAKIKNLASDRNTMLKVFGATKQNTNKNAFQNCLMLYPELLQDPYTKETLRDLKKSIEKDARAGKIDIKGKYLFIIPDMYAFCEWLLLGIQEPEGLLKNKEVYAKPFPDATKLDCLRSPHLYMEHCVRWNVYGIRPELKKWFKTNGIYTSVHDNISKILMFDVDGDKSLVVSDETIIKAAERNIKNMDIVPLYYNMQKAGVTLINYHSMYEGMIAAYTGGNIGEISNSITKIWNSPAPDVEAIKILCLKNNETIDYAKTLYKSNTPPSWRKRLNSVKSKKTPCFFMYAKDKEEKQVELRGNSCVDRLYYIIKSPKFSFSKKSLGVFDYRVLMHNPLIEFDETAEKIIQKYCELTKHLVYRVTTTDGFVGNINYIMRDIKDELLNFGKSIEEVTDILVKYLFDTKDTRYKLSFWQCFGDIVYENVLRNSTSLGSLCQRCGKRFIKNSNRHVFCDDCRDDVYKEKAKERVRIFRNM